MSNTKKITSVTPLIINGQAFAPDQDGAYRVTAGELGVTDLSTIPEGITLHITDAATSMSCVPVRVLWVDVESGHIAVTGIACQFARGWKYTLARAKYWAIGEVILKDLEANRSDIIYDGKVRDGLLFTQLFNAGSFPDIDDQIRDVVGKALKPLFDFRDRMDVECLKIFGV